MSRYDTGMGIRETLFLGSSAASPSKDGPPSGLVEALSGAEVARRIEAAGESKVRANLASTLVLSILAGMFIALGANAFTVIMVGAPPGGLARLAGGAVFSLGLIFVVLAGAELVTGNALQSVAWVRRRITTLELLKSWGLVYLGNLAGSLALVAIVHLSGQANLMGGQIGQTMVTIAASKVHYTFLQAFLLGVLCNTLVCLAVWLTAAGRTVTDKVLVIVPPIAVFILCGYEHSVANMYLIPVGLLTDGGATDGLTWSAFLVNNLLPVTLGNMLGGALLVGVAYWYVHLRTQPSSS